MAYCIVNLDIMSSDWISRITHDGLSFAVLAKFAILMTVILAYYIALSHLVKDAKSFVGNSSDSECKKKTPKLAKNIVLVK